MIKDKSKKTVIFSARVDKDVAKRFKIKAVNESVPMQQVVEELMLAWLNQLTKP